MADDLTKDYTAGLKVRVEEVVSARVLASQARSEYNQFLYKQIIALADLERITAEGSRGTNASTISTRGAVGQTFLSDLLHFGILHGIRLPRLGQHFRKVLGNHLEAGEPG